MQRSSRAVRLREILRVGSPAGLRDGTCGGIARVVGHDELHALSRDGGVGTDVGELNRERELLTCAWVAADGRAVVGADAVCHMNLARQANVPPARMSLRRVGSAL